MLIFHQLQKTQTLHFLSLECLKCLKKHFFGLCFSIQYNVLI